MSAYAAFKAQDTRLPSPFTAPQSNSILSTAISTKSAFTFSAQNSIITPNSIFLGLAADDHLVIAGIFELIVHRGSVLFNNVHELNEGTSYPIVVPRSQSPPTISGSKSAKPYGKNTIEVLPEFQTVVELRNLHTGLPSIGTYSPSLKSMYYIPPSAHTFQLVTEPEENLFAVFFNSSTMKHINALTQLLATPADTPTTVMVIGSRNCGKSTFSKTVMNNTVNATGKPIAYMDLDPSRSEYSVPGTISITVHHQPKYGTHFAKTNALDNPLNKFCYYGFSSATTYPVHFIQCCRRLVDHYTEHLLPQGISLIVNTPGWLRGLGKEFLEQLTELIHPNQLVYMTHNDAINVGDFAADEFESQDNPDDEVLTSLTYDNLITINATRVASRVGASQADLHDQLVYFHHKDSYLQFDFDQHILFRPPHQLFYAGGAHSKSQRETVAGVYALNCDLAISGEDAVRFTEVTVMALSLVPARDVPNNEKRASGYPEIFTSLDYAKIDPLFVCLCMVHSVNTSEGYLNVYLPEHASILSKAMEPFLERDYVPALVRGEGEVPSAEILMPELLELGQIPYVTSEPKMRVGGVWKARKNIGRKSQK